MKRLLHGIVAFCFLSTSIVCFADAQYTETSKITGGALAGAMKFVGVFSKDAKQATQGTTTTVSVKGNKMRRESSLGTAEIYDLDGRRFISLDLKKKTYSVLTFDELRVQMAEARRKAAEQQAKSQHKGNQESVKITPKISVTPGTGSKKVLDHTAKEVKTRIDMQMEGQDQKGQTQSGNMWVNADTYVAPVKAWDEVKRFNQRMAKELDWVPGEIFSQSGNVQISQPMIEYHKSLATMTGMPLLSYVSVGSGPNPGTTGQAAAEQPTPEKKSNVVTRGIGGMFGKKNKDDTDQKDSSGKSGSLMDMTTEVTSINASSVDAGLFTIPAGFKQVEAKKSH